MSDLITIQLSSDEAKFYLRFLANHVLGDLRKTVNGPFGELCVALGHDPAEALPPLVEYSGKHSYGSRPMFDGEK